ncbi:uncharacterized protein Pbp49 [Epargyreus clarus]|uniref:uncharacterized protein Pbp49 n=1 Tax=Epargyreus clarus TaxID=520877 RepID=UPI003C2DE189
MEEADEAVTIGHAPDQNVQVILLRELDEDESMDMDESNSDLRKNISKMVYESNGKLVIRRQSEDHISLSSACLGDDFVETSQSTREEDYSIQNEQLKKYKAMSVEVSIDRLSSLDVSVDNTNSSFPETSKPVNSAALKSVLEELSIATASDSESLKDSSIKSPTTKDGRAVILEYLRKKTSIGDSEKIEPVEEPVTIVKPPTYKDNKHGKVELYAPDTGPKIYFVKGNIVTPPLITRNLPEAFKALPVHGKPETKAGLGKFYRQKIRDYVGYGINDDEFKRLENFCSPEYLKTGKELAVTYNFPSHGSLPADLRKPPEDNGPGGSLCIVKKLKLRMEKDRLNHYPRKLKYRGLRLLPLTQEDDDQSSNACDMKSSNVVEEAMEGPLEPGRDLIFRVRFYRPYSYGTKTAKTTRHSVFNNDVVLLGRHRLSALRDRIGCANDIGMRIDMSDDPDIFITESAKRVFPSGFLFINNVFYVDRRRGCTDQSAAIRDWARRRRLGTFPVKDLASTRLDTIVLRLGHPEVYMHQGKCEHLFTFSEVRLLGPSDPLQLSSYPCHTAISQNQSVYCTTCAEFGAKWIVVGCTRVPFDPAFFCDTCFKLYLYDKDGKKIGDFKAYSYRGNAVNFLKPTNGYTDEDDEYEEVNGDEDGEEK